MVWQTLIKMNPILLLLVLSVTIPMEVTATQRVFTTKQGSPSTTHGSPVTIPTSASPTSKPVSTTSKPTFTTIKLASTIPEPASTSPEPPTAIPELTLATSKQVSPISKLTLTTSKEATPTTKSTSIISKPVSTSSKSAQTTKRPTLSQGTLSVDQIQDDCPYPCACNWNAKNLIIVGCDQSVSPNELDPLILKHPNVTSLNITKSAFVKLPDEVCSLSSLQTLNLTHNHLKIVQFNCSSRMTHLTTLDLSYNNLTEFHIPEYQVPALSHLFLSHNQIKDIDPRTVCCFPTLQSVALDNNKITDIKPKFFEKCKKLNKIELQSNNLQDLDTWPFPLLGKNVNINLKNNRIFNFTNQAKHPFLCDTQFGGSLNIAQNNISHVMDMLDGWEIKDYQERECFFKESRVIDIEGNPLNCDCVEYDIYVMLKSDTFLHPFKSNLICHLPPRFRGKNMTDLEPDQFVCDLTKNCPPMCKCQQVPLELKLFVNCENTNLTELPETIPAIKTNYTYDLNFVGNLLEDIEKVSFVKRYYLQTSWARFSHNRIDFMLPTVMQALKNAERVFIDHNKLRYLPQGISSVNMTMSVVELRFGYNPYYCDCLIRETWQFLVWMEDWISDKDNMICAEPYNMFSYKIMDQIMDTFACPTEPRGLQYILVGVGAFTAAVWVLVVLLPFYIIYQLRILLWIKFKRHWFNIDECDGEFKEFDIFLCYAEVDKKFAINTIFKWLETQGYKVAHHRNSYIAGKPIAVNIDECVRKSKRTLCILTTAFTRSDWCLLEFCTGLDIDKQQKTQRLLGLQMEELIEDPTGEIELDPRYGWFLPEQRCLAIGDPLLWEKLLYMFPVKKLGYRMIDGRMQMPKHIPYPGPAKKKKKKMEPSPIEKAETARLAALATEQALKDAKAQEEQKTANLEAVVPDVQVRQVRGHDAHNGTDKEPLLRENK